MTALQWHPQWHPLYRQAALAVLALATALFCQAALAQYVWVGESGVRQYSDTPPPASVPANRILKAPGMRSAPAASPDSPPTDAAAPANGAQPAAGQPANAAPTLAQRNAEFNKRRIEQQEQAAKTAEENQQAANRARSCQHARSYMNTLNSGMRVARVDDRGERIFLTDSERAREVDATRRLLSQCD